MKTNCKYASSSCNCPASASKKKNEDTLKRLGGSPAKYDYTIALAGNPNTGKSTVFNSLTGLKQHTGNWSGKTVERAEGAFTYNDSSYRIVDLPGTYSLLSTSEDEEVARNFILFANPNVTLIVADATRLERNLNLVLQILEITERAVLCVNLIDEAKRNGVSLDLPKLSTLLGVPVVGVSARSGYGMSELLEQVDLVAKGKTIINRRPVVSLEGDKEDGLWALEKMIKEQAPNTPNSRWLALRLIEGDKRVANLLEETTKEVWQETQAPYSHDDILSKAMELRIEFGDELHDMLSESIYAEAAQINAEVYQSNTPGGRSKFDRVLDRIVTSRRWGFPIMFLMLAAVLWITIVGSNYPSAWLSHLLVGTIHPYLNGLVDAWGIGSVFTKFLIDGVYLSTAWVVSVMLPPMAIFFPLFTLLEDFGFLPRVAFNLDELFRRSGAHGKQALTMTMGFGCNAAAVVNTRIIDSPRERLIAIITNNFSLCNGRWPTQILIATIFIAPAVPKALQSVAGFAAVVAIALLGIAFMFFFSRLLSRTILRGQVSTFSLELPPYRPPQFWRTLYTSLMDRTLIVLWRAIVFAAPAGALIWLSSNIQIAGLSIAEHLINSFDGFGWLMGLNGVVILAYVLAIPANEIVLPTILMLTTLVLGTDANSAGVMIEADGVNETAAILHAGGWTMLTGISLMLFSLLHNPCSTTLYNIYKETGSIKWTSVAALLPLITGIIVCVLFAFLWRLFI